MVKNQEETISFPQVKFVKDNFEVKFEIEPVENSIGEELKKVNNKLTSNQKTISKLNTEIESLTNSADGIDYLVAVGSGVIAGLIDSFWVGEFNIERGKEWSTDRVNNFVSTLR